MSDRTLTIELTDGIHELRAPTYYGFLLMKRNGFNPFDPEAFGKEKRDERGERIPLLGPDNEQVVVEGEPQWETDFDPEVVPVMLAALMTMAERRDKTFRKVWQPDEVADLIADLSGIDTIMQACMTLITDAMGAGDGKGEAPAEPPTGSTKQRS